MSGGHCLNSQVRILPNISCVNFPFALIHTYNRSRGLPPGGSGAFGGLQPANSDNKLCPLSTTRWFVRMIIRMKKIISWVITLLFNCICSHCRMFWISQLYLWSDASRSQPCCLKKSIFVPHGGNVVLFARRDNNLCIIPITGSVKVVIYLSQYKIFIY